MRDRGFSLAITAVTTLAIFLSPGSVQGQYTEKVLYAFTGGTDGRYPYSGLVSDAAGNLYGTTNNGGATSCYLGCGVVFKLSLASGGAWTENVIYAFTGGSDGGYPLAGLVLDAAGNLYGTTSSGGDLVACPHQGCGTVFKLSPTSQGNWTETVLWSFKGGNDGKVPVVGLIFDAVGNVYGTTAVGGAGSADCAGGGCGTVFELAPTSSGSWNETVLHAFSGGKDGWAPSGTLVFDTVGNLYGTTQMGGSSAICCGVVFKLTPDSVGWSERVIHTFTGGTDGEYPQNSGVTFDAAGNLYGTAYNVFRLQRAHGGWIEGTIHDFTRKGDGRNPWGGLTIDGSGNFYGTTWDPGTVFELKRTSIGWAENILYRFTGRGDGGMPGAAPILDAAGNLYGTTIAGGNYGYGTACQLGCGVVYELSPVSASPTRPTGVR